MTLRLWRKIRSRLSGRLVRPRSCYLSNLHWNPSIYPSIHRYCIEIHLSIHLFIGTALTYIFDVRWSNHRSFYPRKRPSLNSPAEKRPPIYATWKILRSLPSNNTGDRLVASYVNFYLANGAVILPGFGVPEDEVALRLFEVRTHTRNWFCIHRRKNRPF